jgi:hypothetical protein
MLRFLGKRKRRMVMKEIYWENWEALEAARIARKKAQKKKVFARRRSGSSRSNGTRAEDGRVPNKQCANCRQRQPLGQVPAHPNIYTGQAEHIMRNDNHKTRIVIYLLSTTTFSFSCEKLSCFDISLFRRDLHATISFQDFGFF